MTISAGTDCNLENGDYTKNSVNLPSKTDPDFSVKTASNAVVYNLIGDYNSYSQNVDLGYIQTSPDWCLAVYRLGQPVTYSRSAKASFIQDVVTGAFERGDGPLILRNDILSITTIRPKGSHTKNLNAVIKSNINYLSSTNILPGDWVLAWHCNSSEDINNIVKSLQPGSGGMANGFHSGFKFLGRVHSIRKKISVDQGGRRTTVYNLQCIGFEELDTQFFYNLYLASNASQLSSSNIPLFLNQIGLDVVKLWGELAEKAGEAQDNVPDLIEGLIDAIIGSGINRESANAPLSQAYTNIGDKGIKNDQISDDGRKAYITPPLDSAPFSYIVPVSVAKTLGRNVYEKGKKGVFGYSDLLETIIGVQQYGDYSQNADIVEKMYPKLDPSINPKNSRKRCAVGLKGTYLPIPASFVNMPLWNIFEQFLNGAINDIYTCLRPSFNGGGSANGAILPTIVVRQIPFSTESISEDDSFPLTRFLSLPRWKIDPCMVMDLDIGRSNGTRWNMWQVIGNAPASAVKGQQLAANQLVRKPPIFDTTDIARSGIRVNSQIVNCALSDIQRPNAPWLEAIADWSAGSHLTLNGTVQCVGIQSPIAEGDNVEFEGVAYQIESITDICSINPDGIKTWKTVLSLSNGMPIDQNTDYREHFPRYPGFGTQWGDPNHIQVQASSSTGANPDSNPMLTAVGTIKGDDRVLTNQDPGRTVE